jgi:hypothetical protein
MNDALRIPGLSNSWTMPIRGRIDMLSTGIRTPVGLKIHWFYDFRVCDRTFVAARLLPGVSCLLCPILGPF